MREDSEEIIANQEPTDFSVPVEDNPLDTKKESTPSKKRRSGPVAWVILIALLCVLGAILWSIPQISQWATNTFSINGGVSTSTNSSSVSGPLIIGGEITLGSISVMAPIITAMAAVISMLLLLSVSLDLTKIKNDLKEIADEVLKTD